MNYTYGLSIINTYLMAGASIVLCNDSLLSKSFWTRFNRLRVNSFSGVPFNYEVLDKLSFFNKEHLALKVLTQAGGKLNKDLQVKIAKYSKKHGMKFFIMYGQTEATARIAYLDHNMSTDKIGSIGKAIPMGKICLVNESGNEIRYPDSVGEIVYYGKNVMMGYAKNKSDLHKGDEMGGVLYTGDIAKYDDEYCLYIVGRKKRFIKIQGKRFNLDDLEEWLMASVKCRLVCIGADNCLVVVSTQMEMLENIKNLLKEKGIYESYFKIFLSDELPYVSSGKIDYSSLSIKYLKSNGEM